MIYDPTLWTRRRDEMLARYSVRVVTPPATEQVTLEQARLHLRLTATGSPASHPDDQWLTDAGIPAARELCEGLLERAIAPQELELALGGFPLSSSGATAEQLYFGGLMLPMSPVIQVLSVGYTDGDGAVQALDPAVYTLDAWSQPNLLALGFGQAWPTVAGIGNAVRVRYLAGYSLPGDSPLINPLPRAIFAAMLLTLGHLYENREASNELKLAEIPLGVTSLLERYRLRLSAA